MADGDVIEYLVAHGAYVEAARIAAERGELPRAIAALRAGLALRRRLPLALELGDRPLAVRLALDANLPARAAEIADGDATATQLRAVAEAFAARGRPFEAARAAERAGACAARRRLVPPRRRAARRGARARRRRGALREAGLVYERLIAAGQRRRGRRGAPGARAAAGRLGRAEEAARQLQARRARPALDGRRLRALCGPLLALGLRGAAAELAGAPAPRRSRRCRASPRRSPLLEEAVAEPARDGRAERRRRAAASICAGCSARARSGRVYQAVDTLLGAPVALKLLAVGGGARRRSRAPGLPALRARGRGGRAAAPPEHRRARTTRNPRAGLFVFELMAGGTLAERLAAAGPLPLAAARRLALDLLAALGAAHERGIVHRDVKPANVFFDAAGNAKLGDFGGAHLADFGQTQTGGFFGTVAYMSPEQITGAPIGFSADLYALGVTLFEALTGRPPFLGPDLVAQHLGEPPPRPSARRPGLSPAARRGAGARAGQGARRSLRLGARDGRGRRRLADRGRGRSRRRARREPRLAGRRRAGGAAASGSSGGRARRRAWCCATTRARRARSSSRSGRRRSRAQRSTSCARLAAAGGPHVQRVLRLSDDRRAVWYESVAGEPRAAGGAHAVRARRARRRPRRASRRPRPRFVRTPAGPVVLVAPLVD